MFASAPRPFRTDASGIQGSAKESKRNLAVSAFYGRRWVASKPGRERYVLKAKLKSAHEERRVVAVDGDSESAISIFQAMDFIEVESMWLGLSSPFGKKISVFI